MKLVIPCTESRRPQLMILLKQLRYKGLINHSDRVIVVNQINRPYNLGMSRNFGIAYKPHSDDELVVVHDVDNLPTDLYPYSRYPAPFQSAREIVHVYGHGFSLNGVVCASFKTFKECGGYISKNSWGGEDVILQKICEKLGIKVNKSICVKRFPDNHWFVEMDETGTPMHNDRAKKEFQRDIQKKMMGYKEPPPLKGDLRLVSTDVTVLSAETDEHGVETVNISISPRKPVLSW